MLAPSGLNLHFYIFFMDHVQKQIININNKTKEIWTFFCFTHTPIKHHNKTPFMENSNPKCDKNKYKNCQIFKLQNENETKNKIFPCKLYLFNIDACFKHQNTSCTSLKIVYIIQVWKTWIFLNIIIIYNFIFICMLKEKTMELWFQFLNIHNEF
jgi:hypothetical protein